MGEEETERKRKRNTCSIMDVYQSHVRSLPACPPWDSSVSVCWVEKSSQPSVNSGYQMCYETVGAGWQRLKCTHTHTHTLQHLSVWLTWEATHTEWVGGVSTIHSYHLPHVPVAQAHTHTQTRTHTNIPQFTYMNAYISTRKIPDSQYTHTHDTRHTRMNISPHTYIYMHAHTVMAQPVSSAPHSYKQLDKGNQEVWCWMGGTTPEECPRKLLPTRCLWLSLTGVLS